MKNISPKRLLNNIFLKTSGGGGFDADATAYIAAVEAADGQALEAGVKTAINDFVVGCKADGIWTALKASCILSGARTLSGALVPLAGTAPTNNNFVSGDYDRKTGLVGDGSTKYLDSNRQNASDPQNSRHQSVYVSTGNSTSGSPYYVGGGDNGYTGFGMVLSTNALLAYVSHLPTVITVAGQGNTTGFKGVGRSNSSTALVRSAGSTSSFTNVSETATSARTVLVFAQRFTSVADFTNARLAFYSIGESLDLALLDTRVTTLIAAYDAAIISDPSYANVSLLLHGNGTNGSTTITDNSPSPKTVTAEGNAQISTAQSKFGGASIAFDGTGDRVSVANNAAFDFGTGDFTVECWVFSVAALTSYNFEYAHIAGKGSGIAGGEYSLGFYQQKINWFANSTTTQGTTILTNNTWYHFAASRAGSTLKLFVNGLLESSTTNTLNYTSSVSFNAGDRQAGDSGGQYPFNGYIDELRVTKGVARYTANFTPPVSQFLDL